MENSRKGRKFLIFAGKKCIRMAVLLLLVSAATSGWCPYRPWIPFQRMSDRRLWEA